MDPQGIDKTPSHIRILSDWVDGPEFKAMPPADFFILLLMWHLRDWHTSIVGKAAKNIATRAGMCRRAVQFRQARLLRRGFLEQVRRGGGRDYTLFRLTDKTRALFCAADAQESAQHTAQNCAADAHINAQSPNHHHLSSLSTHEGREEWQPKAPSGRRDTGGGNGVAAAADTEENRLKFLHDCGVRGRTAKDLSERLMLRELRAAWASTAAARQRARKNPTGVFIAESNRRYREKLADLKSSPSSTPLQNQTARQRQERATNSDDHGVIAPRIDASESPLDPSKISKIPQNRLTARAAAILSKPEWEQMP